MPTKAVDKGIDLLHIHRYLKYREADIFMSGTTSITYKDGKTIIQESMGEELDYDPIEGRNLNWEDYERLAQTRILMRKVITCQNLSHREKLILSLFLFYYQLFLTAILLNLTKKSCIRFL